MAAPTEKLNTHMPKARFRHDTRDDYITIEGYAQRIAQVVEQVEVTRDRQPIRLQSALIELKESFLECSARGNKVILIGNGGSSAIASHIAVDLTKNHGIRAVSLNDFPTITCLSNDFGYAQVFAKQIEYYAHKDDCLVCISTGGKSPNILNAVGAFHTLGGNRVYTFSGMKPDNALRSSGLINFYSHSYDFGIVEISHLTLLHSLCPCII